MADDATAGTELSTLLKPYQANVQEIVREARRIILAILPDATEAVDSKARLVGYGYGTGYRDIICTLILSKSGVKLGVVVVPRFPTPAISWREREKCIATFRYAPLGIYAARA